MLGIDVSKQELVCALLDPATRQLQRQFTVPNSKPGVAQLLRELPADCPWVLEPTGRYSLLAAQQGQAAGRQVLIAPPKAARLFLASVQRRAKTDRLDSYGLALYGLAHRLRPYPMRTPAVEQLSQLLSARKGIARAAAGFKLQLRELPHAQGELLEVVAALQGQLAALDAQIQQLTADTATFPTVRQLEAVPGIGPVTAASVTACLHAKGFTEPAQFVAYIGLDIGVRQSGRRRGNTGLTKQGNAELRRLLYLAAQANLRCKSSPFKDQYERERAKGLAHPAALCAVARKLARLCWSLVKHETPYDAARVHQQPGPQRRRAAGSPGASTLNGRLPA
jgi:transposase